MHCGPQDDHISAYTVLLSQALQAQSVSFPLFPQKIRLDRIPPDVHTFVAGQLGLLWDHSKHYAWNSRTRDVNKLLALRNPRIWGEVKSDPPIGVLLLNFIPIFRTSAATRS